MATAVCPAGSEQAACVGAATCHRAAAACRPAGAAAIAALAAVDPVLLAHDALNCLGVLGVAARRLAADRDDTTRLAMRALVVERAARLGWTFYALRRGVDDAVTHRAAKVVLAGCALGRWEALDVSERRRLVHDVVTGAVLLAADLHAVIEGRDPVVDLRD